MPSQCPEFPGEQNQGVQFVTLQSLQETLRAASLDDEEALARFARIVEPRLVTLDQHWRSANRATRTYIRNVLGPIVFFDIANDDRTAKALIAAQRAKESPTGLPPIVQSGYRDKAAHAGASLPKQIASPHTPEQGIAVGQLLAHLQASQAECVRLRSALKELFQAAVLQAECLDTAITVAAAALGLPGAERSRATNTPRTPL